MKTIKVKRRIFGIIPCNIEVEKPHITRAHRVIDPYSGRQLPWRCHGANVVSYGRTMKEAWDKWANDHLI
jgi:hypothetical protein